MTKTFKDGILANSYNPAEAFITPKDEPKAEAVAGDKPKPTHKAERATGSEERKSVRVNLLFKPSVKQAIEKLAQYDNTSINDLISRVLTDYTNDRKADIEKIDALRG